MSLYKLITALKGGGGSGNFGHGGRPGKRGGSSGGGGGAGGSSGGSAGGIKQSVDKYVKSHHNEPERVTPSQIKDKLEQEVTDGSFSPARALTNRSGFSGKDKALLDSLYELRTSGSSPKAQVQGKKLKKAISKLPDGDKKRLVDMEVKQQFRDTVNGAATVIAFDSSQDRSSAQKNTMFNSIITSSEKNPIKDNEAVPKYMERLLKG